MMDNDTISRQAAIEEIEPYTDNIYNSTAIEIKEILQRLPSVQPKTGEWILDTTQFLPEYVCTNCKSRFPLVASEGEFYSTLCCKNMNYCPNCGAKMESDKNDN